MALKGSSSPKCTGEGIEILGPVPTDGSDSLLPDVFGNVRGRTGRLTSNQTDQ